MGTNSSYLTARGISQGTTQQQQAGISHSRDVFVQDGEGFSSRAPRDQGIINSSHLLAAAAPQRLGDAAGLAASQGCSQDVQTASCSWQPGPAAWPPHPAWPVPPPGSCFSWDQHRAWECTPGMGQGWVSCTQGVLAWGHLGYLIPTELPMGSPKAQHRQSWWLEEQNSKGKF